MYEETIAAVATAIGEAAIGIIRISGPEAFDVLGAIFVPKKNLPLDHFRNREMIYGHIVESERTIDEVYAVRMAGPATYTREDVVEIHCHGGHLVMQRLLSLILTKGARLAEPGEFTRRAFLNGRLDLVQAEAVMDLIRAKTTKGFDVAMDQLEGELSERIQNLRASYLMLIANLQVSIDYPEEDIEEITYGELVTGMEAIAKELDALIQSGETGKIIRDGLKTAIVGKPNVGKSSLLNALLKEARAIVTNIPGTTRDVIEEYLNIKGVPVRIIDTAGIRETEDTVERMGVERSKRIFNEADLVILVLNASEPMDEEDRQIIDLMHGRKGIVVVNKTDLGEQIDFDMIASRLGDHPLIKTSLTQAIGIEQVEDAIAREVYGGSDWQSGETFVTSARQMSALIRAREHLMTAKDGAESNLPYDLIEIDLKDSLSALGEVSGDTVAEDLLSTIFSKFCLGK